MARPARAGGATDQRLSVRISSTGRDAIRRLAEERATAEGRRIGNGQDDMSEGVIVRRMLKYAANHMPADYDHTPTLEGPSK